MATTTARPAAKPAPAAKPGTAAKGAAPAEEAVAAAPKKKSKLKLVLLVVLVLALLGGGGGAAWYFTLGTAGDKAGDKAKAAAKEASHKPPVFVNLEPFTVNLAAEGADRYLQTTIVLQMTDDKAADALKGYMPVIRNRFLLLLSSKKPSELETVEGKQKLVQELIAAAQAAIPGSSPERGVAGALFSTFVIQ